MKILLLDAFPTDSADRRLIDSAIDQLRSSGHEVTHRVLCGSPFETFMSPQERAAYHGDNPLVTPETSEDAAALQEAHGLLFCYPTTMFTLPAVLKSWLERVLVPGVSFVFNSKGKVRPGMTNIRRIGVITTSVHDKAATRGARDAGRLTILRNLRMSCHTLCKRTFVSVPAGHDGTASVRRALSHW